MRPRKLWLTPDGLPLPDSDLKRVVKSWNAETWEKYLRWYENPLKEYHLSADNYDLICKERSETIYQDYGYETNPALRTYCDELLQSLPKNEAEVLRLYFYDGLTEAKIAIPVQLTRQGVHYVKNKGLSRLKTQKTERSLGTIHIMRGLVVRVDNDSETPWIKISQNLIRENRVYHPENWRSELESIGNVPVRGAIRGLPDTQKRIIYLRFWCDQSSSAIARQLGPGLGIVQEICDSAVSKVKRKTVAITQYPKEVSLCI